MTTLSRIFSASLLIGSCHLMGAGLSLPAALEILENNNLEIKTASLDVQSAQNDTSIAKGYNFGSLDLTQSAMRSNEAGNVFGFKLSSRQASFGDFGFAEFDDTNPNILKFSQKILTIPATKTTTKPNSPICSLSLPAAN